VLKKIDSNSWHFFGHHTTGVIRYERIGLIHRYKTINSNQQSGHFGFLEQAASWLKRNDRPAATGGDQ